jgi:hypothetical protein
MIEKRFAAAIERHAPHGDCHHLSARRLMGCFHFSVRTLFSSANDEPRVKYFSGYFELIG